MGTKGGGGRTPPPSYGGWGTRGSPGRGGSGVEGVGNTWGGSGRSEQCPARCVCRRVAPGVCAVHVPRMTINARRFGRWGYCDVRSAVAYGVHRTAFDRLVWWRNVSLRRSHATAC